MIKLGNLDEKYNVIEVELYEDCNGPQQVQSTYVHNDYRVSTAFLSVTFDFKWFEVAYIDRDGEVHIVGRTCTYDEASKLHVKTVGWLLLGDHTFSSAQYEFIGSMNCPYDELNIEDKFTFEMLG